jgi:hypothetical protein
MVAPYNIQIGAGIVVGSGITVGTAQPGLAIGTEDNQTLVLEDNQELGIE